MKKIFVLITLAVVLMLFTGCLDIFHAVSMKKGQVELTVRYTMQKAIFELGAGMSGEAPDYSEFTDIGDDMFKEFQGLEADVRPIENEFEVGAEIYLKGSVSKMNNAAGERLEFLPQKTDIGWEIMIPGMGDEGGEADDEFAAAFLSSAKYRLLIDLSGDFRDITQASLITAEGEEAPLEEFSAELYGSSMLIEIPMIFLFLTDDDLIIRLN
ncbi:MAG: hypothetical protein PQJ61_14040 [Spirochaetales bacterium]|uniref:Lipoprotein n=1 Tax=Candidatus Thalassospirochaeta sargassi TaxID=3119039 RepID=A0AAJ1MKK3_9SPIO|nr:hypothetical protein [Spirochaetales bacterium]